MKTSLPVKEEAGLQAPSCYQDIGTNFSHSSVGGGGGGGGVVPLSIALVYLK